MTIRNYQENDIHNISCLLCNNFPNTLGGDAICKTWQWQFQNRFSKPSGVSLADLSGEIVAHYAVMWLPMCYQGKAIQGAVSTATVTDSKVRGKGLFTKLAKKVFKETEEDGCKIVFGFPNSQSIRGFIKHLEWFQIATFPVLIKPVHFSPFLKKLVRRSFISTFLSFSLNRIYPFFIRCLRGWTTANTISIEPLIGLFPEEISDIWKSSFASRKIAISREKAYLEWRYLDKPFSDYQSFAAFDEHKQMAGMIITNISVKMGLKIVYVMEMIVRNDDSLVYKNLVEFLDGYARENSADAVSMLCLSNHPIKWLFFRHGFLPVPKRMFPQDIHFCARANSRTIDKDYLQNENNWYITWGDLDVV